MISGIIDGYIYKGMSFMVGRKKRVVITFIVILGMLGVLGFYLYEVFVLKVPYKEHLFRALAVFSTLCGTLVKLNYVSRKPLSFYEKAYADVIGYAFNNNQFLRKKLLCACRLYDESNYRKAMKYLVQLNREAEYDRDRVVVLLFVALCYTDSGLYSDAITVYYELLKIEPNNARAHSNLGFVYVKEGDFDMAVKHYTKSIECEPSNYYAYTNRADCYFKLSKYDDAVCDAQKALAFKNNGVEAAGLLAIIFALTGDEENKRKYFHLAVSSGKNPEDLKQAIEYYLAVN